MTQRISGVSLLLAIVFESWVFAQQPGLGHLLFWGVTVLATLYLVLRAERKRLPSAWMFLPSALIATSVFLYDAGVVQFWGPILGPLFLFWAVAWNLLKEREPDALARTMPEGSLSPIPILASGRDALQLAVNWNSDKSGAIWPVLRGVLLSAPILTLFGVLLASADQVFANSIDGLLTNFGMGSLASPLRVLIWLVFITGCFKVLIQSAKATKPVAKFSIPTTELTVALGSLNLLLAYFLLLQGRFLIDGENMVRALGISYADCARGGFFELTACIGLILPLVLLAYQSAEVNGQGKLRLLGFGLIVSAGGLALTALQRMLLYIGAFGMSIERFYAASGIIVAMLVLAWAAWACLRLRSVAWILTRQTVTVAFCLGLLSLVNVEALVARHNLELECQNVHALDRSYLEGLSSDILPVLRDYEKKIGKDKGNWLPAIHRHIVARTSHSNGSSYNLSRHQAHHWSGEDDRGIWAGRGASTQVAQSNESW